MRARVLISLGTYLPGDIVEGHRAVKYLAAGYAEPIRDDEKIETADVKPKLERASLTKATSK